MALANERAGYVSSPLPSVAGQVEVAPGGAGGRARACGGESGRVTVVTDHLSVRGEAGREGKGREGGSARFRSRSRGRGGAPWSGPLPARRGREQGLVRGGWWWWWCTRAVPLALPPRGCTLPRPPSRFFRFSGLSPLPALFSLFSSYQHPTLCDSPNNWPSSGSPAKLDYCVPQKCFPSS